MWILIRDIFGWFNSDHNCTIIADNVDIIIALREDSVKWLLIKTKKNDAVGKVSWDCYRPQRWVINLHRKHPLHNCFAIFPTMHSSRFYYIFSLRRFSLFDVNLLGWSIFLSWENVIYKGFGLDGIKLHEWFHLDLVITWNTLHEIKFASHHFSAIKWKRWRWR